MQELPIDDLVGDIRNYAGGHDSADVVLFESRDFFCPTVRLTGEK